MPGFGGGGQRSQPSCDRGIRTTLPAWMVGSGGSKKRGKDLRDLGFIEEGDFRIEVGG